MDEHRGIKHMDEHQRIKHMDEHQRMKNFDEHRRIKNIYGHREIKNMAEHRGIKNMGELQRKLDEMLIVACLAERRPTSSLPWDKDGEKSEVDGSADEKITSNAKESSQSNNGGYERGSRFRDIDQNSSLQKTRKTLCRERLDILKLEQDDKTEGRLKMHEPSYGAMGSVSHSHSDKRRTTRTQGYAIRGKVGVNTSASCLPGSKTQVRTKENSRCSVKVSRNVVLESKSGNSVPKEPKSSVTVGQKRNSINSCSNVEIGGCSNTREVSRGCLNDGKTYLPKISFTEVSKSQVKRNRDNICPNKHDKTESFEIDVDKELDKLLKETDDVLNYEEKKHIKGKERKFIDEHLRHLNHEKANQDKNAYTSNDYERDNDCVSIYEACKNREENTSTEKGNKSKSISGDQVAKSYIRRPFDPIEDVRDREIDARHQVIQKNAIMEDSNVESLRDTKGSCLDRPIAKNVPKKKMIIERSDAVNENAVTESRKRRSSSQNENQSEDLEEDRLNKNDYECANAKGSIYAPMKTDTNNDNSDKDEKKLNKMQRFINFIMGCCKPKADE